MVGATHRHWLHQHGRLGASHVRGRNELYDEQRVLRRFDHAGRGAYWRSRYFNWLATMYGGKDESFATPHALLRAGFYFQFLVAGPDRGDAGSRPVRLAACTTLTSSSGHFHFTLIGGLVFALFAAYVLLVPEGQSGKDPRARLSASGISGSFGIGFNMTFIPMHFLRLSRDAAAASIHTPLDRGWELWNLISSVGVIFQSAGVLAFVWNVVKSSLWGKPAGDDPWDGWTLEWTTSSPPPEYNFEKLPVVRSSRPLWDLKHPQDPDWKYE